MQFPEVSPVSLEFFLLHLVAVRLDRQSSDGPNQRPALFLGVCTHRQGANVLFCSRVGVVDAFPVERARY